METQVQKHEMIEYDLALTDEQREIRETARRFALEVLRPVGRRLDRMAPDEVIASGSPLYDVVAQAARLGFTRLRAPVSLGGLEAAPATEHIVLEELAYGSAGLAGVIFLSSFPAITQYMATGKMPKIPYPPK